MSDQESVRKPAVSGMFYPSDPVALESMVKEKLEREECHVEVGVPKALVVPHAGYVYSGDVAASAFSLLAHWPCSVHRVVILGPSHHFPFEGMAIPDSMAFATPLGEVPVADDLTTTFEEISCVKNEDGVHAPEHSIEVELPFLQVSLPEFKLIPIVTGEASAAEVASVLETVWGEGDTLILISTDLSHFHDDHKAKQLDTYTCQAVESLDHEALSAKHACGYVALRGMLLAAQNHHLGVRTLKMMNSGDVSGDHSSVVGYGAWAFYEN